MSDIVIATTKQSPFGWRWLRRPEFTLSKAKGAVRNDMLLRRPEFTLSKAKGAARTNECDIVKVVLQRNIPLQAASGTGR